jgi:hypothetical protein
MRKWFGGASVFLVVIFCLLYIGAKIHFFTRYWPPVLVFTWKSIGFSGPAWQSSL